MSIIKVQGDTDHNTTDSGNPVKVGGIGRTANPTIGQDGDRVSLFADILGRVVMIAQQVRDLVTSGYATLTRGQETTVLAAAADTFHDVVMVSAVNDSTVALSVDFRDVAAGSVLFRMLIPASDMKTKTFNVPQPQTTVNTDWTAQVSGSDISDSPVRCFIQAVKNI